MTNPSVYLNSTEALPENYTDAEKKEIVQKLNDDIARLSTPVTIYVSFLMVSGLFGNLLVCYYYGFATKRTTYSFFIIILALYDLIVCCVAMPTEIVDIVLNYTFENNAACKILRFVSFLAGIGSVLTLVAIATDRFMKIVKPTGPPMSLTAAGRITLVVFCIAMLLASPSLVIHGAIKVNIPNSLGIDLQGSDCTSTKDSRYKKYVLAFNGVLFILFFVCTAVFVLLYSVIGRSIYLHRKLLRRYSTRTTNDSSGPETSSSKVSDEDKLENDSKASSLNVQPTSGNPEIENVPMIPVKKSFVEASNKQSKSRSSEVVVDRETLKLTVVMIIVTVVFIVSFLPYFYLKVWRAIKGKHEGEILSGSALVAFKIGTRSYLLNSSLNPWIYGIFNRNFRKFVCDLLLCRRRSN